MDITAHILNITKAYKKKYGIDIESGKIALNKKTYIVYDIFTLEVLYLYPEEHEQSLKLSDIMEAMVKHSGIILFDIRSENDIQNLSVYEMDCRYEKVFGLFIGGGLNG